MVSSLHLVYRVFSVRICFFPICIYSWEYKQWIVVQHNLKPELLSPQECMRVYLDAIDVSGYTNKV